MDLKKIKIKNYKGIKEADIDLSDGNIFPIVGINESGKTTILEAINFINNNTKMKNTEITDIIPSDLKANFNDDISVEYIFQLTEDEIKNINSLFLTPSEIKLDNTDKREAIHKILYKFENSTLIGDKNSGYWTINLQCKKKSQKKYKTLYELNKDIWTKIILYIKSDLLKKIIFVPSDISEIKNEYNITNTETSLSHIKIHDGINQLFKKSVDTTDDIWDKFKFIQEKNESSDEIIVAILLKMKNLLQKEFSNQWTALIGKKNDKKIEFDLRFNKPNNSIFFNINGENSTEKIGQRSLGFRWLLAFVLITKFYDNNNIIFILDEPASNLHSSAQLMLLDAFTQISKNNKIIYTTHSPYLISPYYLDTTYIIKNQNISDDDIFNIKNVASSIKMSKYRVEINRGSNVIHYQVIIDALEFSPSMINFNSKFNIVLEGKNDYSTLIYFSKILNIEKEYNFIPCKNAHSTSSVISILIGLSNNFCVLYDNDSEGLKNKLENNELFQLNRCYSLNELIGDDNISNMESLISVNDKNAKNLKTKNSINSFISEKRLKQDFTDTWNDETKNNFRKIFDFLDKLGENNE